MKKYIVIGGGTGGASVAARLRHLDDHAQITIVERGNEVSLASCGLPYYVGGVIQEEQRLIITPFEQFKEWMNIDVMLKTQAVGIDGDKKQVRLRNIETSGEQTLEYDALVVSVGKAKTLPKIEGLAHDGVFTLHSLSDAVKIQEYITNAQPKKAAVIGNGFLALEIAENLHTQGMSVEIITAQERVLPDLDTEMNAIVCQQLAANNVIVQTKQKITEIQHTDDSSPLLLYGQANRTASADVTVVLCEHTADTAAFAQSGLRCSSDGRVIVGSDLRTNIADVYALGDAAVLEGSAEKTGFRGSTASAAVKQARVAADSIVRGTGRQWKEPLGTRIVSVFGITAAVTGDSEEAAKNKGKETAALLTYGSNHIGYYPESLPLVIKTVFHPTTGKLYGAQVVGFDGVDKRIDVLSEALRRESSVRDLADFEHAYAPPVSNILDPVNVAGIAAENVLDGLVTPIPCTAIAKAVEEGAFLIDVRTPEEFEIGSIPDAVNIPLDTIRARIDDIPRDKPVIIFCVVGVRGYLAARILTENGVNTVYNVSGGYKTWKAVHEMHRQQIQNKEATTAMSTKTNESAAEFSGKIITVDACGLQCPGPIMRLKQEIDSAPDGARVVLKASDPGFARDAQAWANMTGNQLISLDQTGAITEAVIQKGGGQKPLNTGGSLDGATVIVFSDDLDKVLASFVLANGAAAAGKNPTMFFTFWGLSVLKRKRKPPVRKDFMGRMFSMMLPGNVDKLALSKMNFGGAGAKMMKGRMTAKQVDQLETMMAQARQAGIRFVACQMSMDIMGVSKEELIDGVEIGGVATYMEAAANSNINLFI